jgi:vacuolar protein sorting-associated protein IST1
MPAPNTQTTKLKHQLKLSITRLRMLQQKASAIAKQSRRHMAQLLEIGKDASALIRVEGIIQSDIHTEMLELVELYAELVVARVGVLDQSHSVSGGGLFSSGGGSGGGAGGRGGNKEDGAVAAAMNLDPGLLEAVASLIYAAPRTEVKELQIARSLLIERFGKEFATRCAEGEGVGDRLKEKLTVKVPSEELVKLYLGEIARTYGIRWPRDQPTDTDGDGGEGGGSKEGMIEADTAHGDGDDDGDGAGGGGGAKEPRQKEDPLTTRELSQATPPQDFDLGPKSPVSVVPARGSTENVSPRIKLPAPPELKPGVRVVGRSGGGTPAAAAAGGGGAGAGAVGGKIPEIDDLAKRFAALKK